MRFRFLSRNIYDGTILPSDKRKWKDSDVIRIALVMRSCTTAHPMNLPHTTHVAIPACKRHVDVLSHALGVELRALAQGETTRYEHLVIADYFYLGTVQTKPRICVILGMCAGSILYAWIDLDVSSTIGFTGYAWLAANVAATTAYQIKANSLVNELDINSWTMAYYNNLLSLPVCANIGIYRREADALCEFTANNRATTRSTLRSLSRARSDFFKRLRVLTQPTDHTDEYHDSQQYQQVRAHILHRLFYGLLHLVLLCHRRSGRRDGLRGEL